MISKCLGVARNVTLTLQFTQKYKTKYIISICYWSHWHHASRIHNACVWYV